GTMQSIIKDIVVGIISSLIVDILRGDDVIDFVRKKAAEEERNGEPILREAPLPKVSQAAEFSKTSAANSSSAQSVSMHLTPSAAQGASSERVSSFFSPPPLCCACILLCPGISPLGRCPIRPLPQTLLPHAMHCAPQA